MSRLIRAIATAAARDAGNSDVLIERARDLCGVELEIISGREAELAFRAVSSHHITDNHQSRVRYRWRQHRTDHRRW